MYAKSQMRCGNPKGPIGLTCANLFQGLLRDGHHAKFSMYYRNHGSDTRWQYVASDYRRYEPTAEAFTWRYDQLENTILDYITDLDWSSLTVSTDSDVRVLKDKLIVIEAKVKHLNAEMAGLAALGSIATDIPEFRGKVTAIEAERTELRREAADLRSKLKSKENFMASDGRKLIRELATKRKTIDNRLRLRLAIRHHIRQIELFKEAPKEILTDPKTKTGKCIKIAFTNGAERWIFPRVDARMDGGKMFPHEPDRVQDDIGAVIAERGAKLPKTKFEQWKKRKLKL
jgi:hypothetical protein